MQTTSRSRPARTGFAVAAAVLAVALSACGGTSAAAPGSTTPAAGGSASTASTASTAAAATALTMQASWVNDAEFMGYFTAMDEKLYEQHGIDLTYLPGGPSVVPESTLLAGEADLALTSPDTTITAISTQEAPFVIIGAQYQKNPLGVVSLKSSNINGPADLVGKTVAVPDVNRLAFAAMLTINGIDPNSVTVVPYAYDPTPLITGEVDATLDFVTNVPFTIGEQGKEASAFTLYDVGYKIPNDTVVVTKDTLATKRDAIKAWLQASAAGWEKNFEDPAALPATFADSYFQGTGRTIANEVFFNKAQQPLIENADGIYELSPQAIQDTIDSLALVNITATPEMFDMSLFD